MTFLARVCIALTKAHVRYAIVGGHAVALHGAVRGTVDVDIAVNWELRALAKAEKALNTIDLQSRLPVTSKDIYQFRDEYVKNRNLIAWNFYNPKDLSEQLDIIINYDLKGKKTKRIKLGTTTVPILQIDDLIAMKKQSGRTQDLEDIKALEQIK